MDDGAVLGGLLAFLFLFALALCLGKRGGEDAALDLPVEVEEDALDNRDPVVKDRKACADQQQHQVTRRLVDHVPKFFVDVLGGIEIEEVEDPESKNKREYRSDRE